MKTFQNDLINTKPSHSLYYILIKFVLVLETKQFYNIKEILVYLIKRKYEIICKQCSE